MLDLGLPDIDGVEVIRGLRGWTTVPIIVLSGRAGSADKVAALDAGADDYVTKPFGVDELLARIRAVTRRLASAPATAPPVPGSGRHTVDLADPRRHPRRRRRGPAHPHPVGACWRGCCATPGKLVSQRQLLHEVWGPEYQHETNYLRQYLAQLRRKLEDDPARPRHLHHRAGDGLPLPPLTRAARPQAAYRR